MRVLTWLSKPVLAAFLASATTALVMGGPPTILRTERTVVQRAPGTTRVIHETRYVCDPSVLAKLSNTTKDASSVSGDAEVGSSSSAHGDTAQSQSANASSGDAVNGQLTNIRADGCAQVVANLVNTCIDCRAETGDAEARNEAEAVSAVGSAPSSSPSPSPTPGVQGDAQSSPPVAPSPAPTASPTPSPVASLLP